MLEDALGPNEFVKAYKIVKDVILEIYLNILAR